MKLTRLAVLALALAAPALRGGAQQMRAPAVAAARGAAVAAVGAIALTVSDMDRSVAFYTSVLRFQKVADTVAMGEGYGRLESVPASRIRVVQLRLGDEALQLIFEAGIGGSRIGFSDNLSELLSPFRSASAVSARF